MALALIQQGFAGSNQKMYRWLVPVASRGSGDVELGGAGVRRSGAKPSLARVYVWCKLKRLGGTAGA